jgi:fucose permease
MVLPLLGGFFIDRIGIRIGMFIFTTCMILGQGIMWYGASSGVYYLMLVGNFIFGLGSESMSISTSKINYAYLL